MREVDTVGRLSDTRFVMLMDGPITADTASRLAQRILAQCLRPIRGRPEGWTPRVRMALGVLPRDGQDPHVVLDQLAIMLETVAPGDSRALFQRVLRVLRGGQPIFFRLFSPLAHVRSAQAAIFRVASRSLRAASRCACSCCT